ncbi:kelch-like protein diablo [Paramacrobiotus metropolitanus]|uniref:kelch-like protein diablo n=1 Tax=Paramacrobiotus metropolitanus TaxID=2943436 RepID=UPI002445FC26|nr:kelch-like protein diablo [Paramacrobiotus metropolitanus]
MSSEQIQASAAPAGVRSSVAGAMTERLVIGLQEMKSSGVLCDVVLKGAEESAVGIPCHRLVLSAQSSYFRTMFASDWKESSEKVIQLRNIFCNTLQKLVDFVYTLQIVIGNDDVQSLLAAAIFLDFSPVVTLCWDFLEKHMDVSSYLQVYSLAKMHNNPRLAEKAKKLVVRHFVQIAQSSEFSLVDAETIVELAASDDLCAESEDEVFEAVKRWYEYDQTGRQAQLSDVLQYIRVPFLSPKRLESYFLALFNGLLSSAAGGYPSQSTAVEELPGRKNDAILSRCRPRKSHGLPKVVVCVGGWNEDDGRMDTVHVFSPSLSAVWNFDAPKFPQAVVGCGMAMTENNEIIVCGGVVENGSHGTHRVRQLDLFRNECTDLARMHLGRIYVGVAALNGRIYAVGGCSGAATVLDAVECYDPEKDVWRSVVALPHPLAAFAMVATKDRLYVFGGVVQMGAEPVNSTFCYDPGADAWSKLADMPTARRFCSACVGPNNVIYVIGGRGSDGDLHYVEAYDPSSNCWSKKSDMIKARWAAGCGCVDGKVYVLGGCSGPTDRDIEVYDEETNTWSLLPCRLPKAIVGFGCAVMTLKKESAVFSCRRRPPF